MSLAPPGTLARRRQQTGVDAAALQMKRCPHTTGERREAYGRFAHYRCVDCGALRAIWERDANAHWTQTWSHDGPG